MFLVVGWADPTWDDAFRGDLYYRLVVVSLETRSLRSRPQDIIPLAEHYLNTLVNALANFYEEEPKVDDLGVLVAEGARYRCVYADPPSPFATKADAASSRRSSSHRRAAKSSRKRRPYGGEALAHDGSRMHDAVAEAEGCRLQETSGKLVCPCSFRRAARA